MENHSTIQNQGHNQHAQNKRPPDPHATIQRNRDLEEARPILDKNDGMIPLEIGLKGRSSQPLRQETDWVWLASQVFAFVHLEIVDDVTVGFVVRVMWVLASKLILRSTKPYTV